MFRISPCWLIVLLLTLLSVNVKAQSSNCTIKSGDLLFYEDTSGMGTAVQKSTGHYTHVALAERSNDTLWVIDATPRHGVSRHPFFKNPSDTTSFPAIYRLTVPFDTASVIIRAKSLIGKPYDNFFLPDNEAYYCSELIYEIFLDGSGNHLFEAKPMNWRDKEGKLPEYWQKHFEKLNIPVPEGVPGTNPTDLSKSPLLKRQ